MASVLECIDKLVVAKVISRAVAEEAAEFFQRSRAEWSAKVGPASADAEAALATAKKMHDTSVENMRAIERNVSRFRTIEQRVVEDPRGRNAAGAGTLTKDITGDSRLDDLRKSDPQHPIFTDSNLDYRGREVGRQLVGMLGDSLEKFKPGWFQDKARTLASNRNFIYELFGVDTGNADAKALAQGFRAMSDHGVKLAKAAGRVFNELENWRIFQGWDAARVGRVSEAEYVKDYMEQIAKGGLKLIDQETNRYATGDRYEDILKKAYSDIRTEGGRDAPFSKNKRTFEFQDGQLGADAWLGLQAKYGVGNEVMKAVMGHVDHMARTIALHQQFGGNPDAVFAAMLRLIKDKPSPSVRGLGFLTSARTLQLTYDVLSGRGNPVANESVARFMSGARDLVGVASLRNLPITIIPSDTITTFLASNFHGMSGFNVLRHVFNASMTREVAAHLGISAHGYMDFTNNFVRKYEDAINVSGLARKVSRGVVSATGAEMWTRNGRLGYRVSQLNQLAEMRDIPFGQLDRGVRENFLGQYGFTAKDWDHIRSTEMWEAPNGAKYIVPQNLEHNTMERLMTAIDERASYAFHEPDARTQALMMQGQEAGSFGGELVRSVAQYKQFTMERMTTHLMRALVDGPLENRIARGIAFAIGSMAAGAVSLQAASVVNGKSPLDMANPKFWIDAFIRGGASGIYGDIANAAMRGDRGGTSIAAQMLGPIPGFLGDVTALGANPARRELDEMGRSKATFGGDVIAFGRRWSPATWYTKLAIDRMMWDKLQVLLDPNYRQSFRRGEQRAQKQGSTFWWAQGRSTPNFMQ